MFTCCGFSQCVYSFQATPALTTVNMFYYCLLVVSNCWQGDITHVLWHLDFPKWPGELNNFHGAQILTLLQGWYLFVFPGNRIIPCICALDGTSVAPQLVGGAKYCCHCLANTIPFTKWVRKNAAMINSQFLFSNHVIAQHSKRLTKMFQCTKTN